MYNVSALMWYLNEYNRHNISIHMQGFTNPTLTWRKIQDGRQRWPQTNPFGPNFAMGTTKTVFWTLSGFQICR